MTKREMRTILLRKTGAGVKVSTIIGTTTYLFFESDSFENAVEEAKKHFRHGERLQFYSTVWARKNQFNEYMKQCSKLYDRAWNEPENDSGFETWRSYKRFLIRILMEWTGCSRLSATLQVSSNFIYSSFKGCVAA